MVNTLTLRIEQPNGQTLTFTGMSRVAVKRYLWHYWEPGRVKRYTVTSD